MKPFNPILGETCEAYFPDGTKIYIDHIRHHPPISYFNLYGKGWKMHGYYRFAAKVLKFQNAIEIGFEGPNTITFDDGQEITF